MGWIPRKSRGPANEQASEQEAPPDYPALPVATSHATSDAVEPTVDVSTLLGPSNVPSPLHDAPRTSTGEVDWVRLHHVLEAVDSLLRAGMVGHARSVVSEAKAIVGAALPRSADVIDLARARRSE